MCKLETIPRKAYSVNRITTRTYGELAPEFVFVLETKPTIRARFQKIDSFFIKRHATERMAQLIHQSPQKFFRLVRLEYSLNHAKTTVEYHYIRIVQDLRRAKIIARYDPRNKETQGILLHP